MHLLLNHVHYATSYENLRIVNKVTAKTFREAALLCDLLEGDDNCESKETSVYEMPFALRRYLQLSLRFPRDPQLLWLIFKALMPEDFLSKKNLDSCS